MDIEKSFFNKTTFCPRFLGKKMLNKSNFEYNEITKDCKLHYNKINDQFTLLFQRNGEKKYKNMIIVLYQLDPGVRTFLTGLSNNKHYEICTNIYKKLKKYLKKVDKVTKSKKTKKMEI
jgi:hypothetical protein